MKYASHYWSTLFDTDNVNLGCLQLFFQEFLQIPIFVRISTYYLLFVLYNRRWSFSAYSKLSSGYIIELFQLLSLKRVFTLCPLRLSIRIYLIRPSNKTGRFSFSLSLSLSHHCVADYCAFMSIRCFWGGRRGEGGGFIFDCCFLFKWVNVKK